MTEKVVLVGGGLAHLYFLKQLQNRAPLHCDITLLTTKTDYYYTGMYSGYVEGHYSLDQLKINIAQLAEQAGVTYTQGKALSIDVKQKKVLTDKGDVLSFDVASFDMDPKRKQTHQLPNATTIVHPDLPAHMIELGKKERKCGNVIVVAQDETGVELSLALNAWQRNKQKTGGVTLFTVFSNYLNYMPGTSRCSLKLKKHLTHVGIDYYEREHVVRVEDYAIHTNNVRRHFDTLFWMTEAEAPNLFTSSGLPTDNEGYLLVEDTLQVKKYPYLFGAGGGITIRDFPTLPKNEKMAVRQGKVLWENVTGFLHSGEGSLFTPPKRELSMLSIGQKKGLFQYGSLCFYGRTAWNLKNVVDRSFVSSFQ